MNEKKKKSMVEVCGYLCWKVNVVGVGGRRGCVSTPREMRLLLVGYRDCWWTAALLMYGSRMYGCERWTIKKTERWRTNAFKLVLGKTLEALGLKRDRTSQSSRKSTQNTHWKDWCRSWSSNTLATWCKEPTLGKDPDVGNVWGQEEKGATENEIAGWHHLLNRHEF